ncbi:MAG: NADPH:quinone oxidoreductase family protein [Azospirillaceae bacterium]|nr:NADPH:quinone oxidoreductase family protein [Azospirillaceae bacterium]
MVRAVVCRDRGEPESLVISDLPSAPVGPGQVRIAVHAAGINFADTLIVAGTYQERPALPFVPGFELAGVVSEIGQDQRLRLRLGDRVMAVIGHGAFADEVVVDVRDVYPIPDSMDFVTAAGFAIAYGTAHLALVAQARLRSGEVLVVHGAAGGVGLTAVEVGKALGATVIATASTPERLAIAAGRGADFGIDYGREDVKTRVRELTAGRGADVIYDPIGGEIFEASLRCTAWGGRILIVGFAGGRVPQIPANLLLVKNISAVGFYWGSYQRHAPDLVAGSFRRLFDWYEKGQLRPLVSQHFDLASVAEGLRLLKERQATGKVVLTTGR